MTDKAGAVGIPAATGAVLNALIVKCKHCGARPGSVCTNIFTGRATWIHGNRLDHYEHVRSGYLIFEEVEFPDV